MRWGRFALSPKFVRLQRVFTRLLLLGCFTFVTVGRIGTGLRSDNRTHRHESAHIPLKAKSVHPVSSLPSRETNIGFGARFKVSETYGKLPLSFEANQGQTDPQVKFFSRGHGYTLFLTSTEAVLALCTAHEKSESMSQKVKIENENQVAQPSSFNAAAFPGFFKPQTSRGGRLQGHAELAGYNRSEDLEQGESPSGPEPPSPAVLRMKLAGANPSAKIKGL